MKRKGDLVDSLDKKLFFSKKAQFIASFLLVSAKMKFRVTLEMLLIENKYLNKVGFA